VRSITIWIAMIVLLGLLVIKDLDPVSDRPGGLSREEPYHGAMSWSVGREAAPAKADETCEAKEAAQAARGHPRLRGRDQRLGLGLLVLAQHGAPAHRSLPRIRHPQIKGRLLKPSGLKTDRAEISLLPSSDLE
jgi:hypothetical protein